MKKNSGQSMILILIALPVIMLIAVLTVREGRTMLMHHRAENFCHRRTLDILKIQIEGIETLAQFNPWAKAVIDIKRALLPYSWIPQVASTIQMLRNIQLMIEVMQKTLTYKTLFEAFQKATESAPQFIAEKASVNFGPKMMMMAHGFPGALRLHIKKRQFYTEEKGAPYVLDDDFENSQIAVGRLKFDTEKVHRKFGEELTMQNRKYQKSSEMTVSCESRVKMKNMEDKEWIVQIAKDRPSLSQYLPWL